MDSVLSVSELTNAIKERLEGEFRFVQLEGEVSNFSPASSGHWYFTLKDENAVIQAVMFQNRIRFLGFVPGNGMKVIVSGAVSVYAKRGNYQIICEQMKHGGEGRILAMLEERKRLLAAEGLFDLDRKKALPILPRRVAVVTSPTGAAIRDILQVLARRAAGLDVVVVPAAVQGEGAAAELSRQLLRADRLGLGDVIIIGRGGGSLEDLLPFSDEGLVRAIASCKTPVISAVGHETDSSLCDLVADLRAPTPSAAAELVAGSREGLLRRIVSSGSSITHSFVSKIKVIKTSLRAFRPDEIESRFRALLHAPTMRIDDARKTVMDGMIRTIERLQFRVSAKSAEINAMSPYAVLERGYAIIRTVIGEQIIAKSDRAGPHEAIIVQWSDGRKTARIDP